MINGLSADRLGPNEVVYIRRPEVGLEAIVVVDNTAAGPSIGGVRMAPDVSLDECARLARAMTLKNASAGLPHGGGKSVIKANPAMPRAEKQSLIRAFAKSVAHIAGYIPGPDMGTNEEAMAWVLDETGRAVGLPRVLGGIPLDEIGATGHGLVSAIKAAEEFSSIDVKNARIAVEGFGAVGMHAARLLASSGGKIVAASDSAGSIFDPGGLPVDELIALKAGGRKLKSLSDSNVGKGPPEAAITCECDILIPAARPDVITEENVNEIKARLVVQGANIPATPGAEKSLHDRGAIVIPDYIANAGGVICASVEFHGGTESQALSTIDEKIRQNVKAVLKKSRDEKTLPRQAADRIARERVEEAAKYRRFG